MLLSHAPPPPFLRTLLHYYCHNCPRHCPRASSSIISLFETTLPIAKRLSHSCRSSLLPMSAATGDSFSSSPEHDAGEWNSVPELRLRDHRFTVPLDYTRGLHASPKISVFAREVVSGNTSQKSQTVLIVFAAFDCINCLFLSLGFLVAWRFNVVISC